MNYQGCCLVVFSSRSYTNILQVIKNLQAGDYTENQISVMGRRAIDKRGKGRFLSLFKSFNYEKTEKYFWDTLSDLLRGRTCFQTSDKYSVEITGELSKADLKHTHNEGIQDSSADIDNLLSFVGVPKVSFEYYKSALNNSQSLLIIHGNYQELKRAGNLLDLLSNINVSMHLTSS